MAKTTRTIKCFNLSPAQLRFWVWFVQTPRSTDVSLCAEERDANGPTDRTNPSVAGCKACEGVGCDACY